MSVRVLGASASIVMCVFLSACGGGGGGGGVTPAPNPTPPPAPAGPQPLSLLGPSTSMNVQGALPTNAHFNVTVGPSRESGADVEVIVTDPDVSGVARFDQINFDGDETIRVRQTSSGLDQTFTASQYQLAFGGAPRALFPDTAGRNIIFSQWGTGDPDGFQNVFRVYRLNKGAYADRAPAAGGAPILASNPATYVALVESGRVAPGTNLGGLFQTVGVQTTAADMPRTGSLHFDGQAYGYVYRGGMAVGNPGVYSSSGERFIARASLDVDLSRSVNNLTGLISTPTFQPPLRPGNPTEATFQIQLAGSTQGSTFSATATSQWHGSPMAGAATGAFYGPSTAPATEVGGVFAVTSTVSTGDVAGDRIVGGFIGGR